MASAGSDLRSQIEARRSGHGREGRQAGRDADHSVPPNRLRCRHLSSALHRRARRGSDVQRVARWAAPSERTGDMADLRGCIGSARFGIEAHEAPVTDFPVQPSQKDAPGRLCRPHWDQYTTALRKAAAAAKAEATMPAGDATTPE